MNPREQQLFLEALELPDADRGPFLQRECAEDIPLRAREALDRAGEKVGPRFKNQPLTEAAVRVAIGLAYQGVGDFANAALHFDHQRNCARPRSGRSIPLPWNR